jgi:hypothetical protein
MKIIVNITPEDIAAGVPGRSDECPFGLAAQRAIAACNVSMSPKRQLMGIPSAAVDFMRRFDNREKVDPIKITMEL